MINNVVLMGRLVRDPELRSTSTGVSVASFCIAVDRNYVAKGEDKKTDFINCVAWKQTAEFIDRYFSKGSMITVVGSLQTRSYDDKDGNKRTAYEVAAEKIGFCGGKESSGGTETKPSNKGGSTERFDMNDQDLPF